MRVVFLGTPEFAAPALRILHGLGMVNLVVSQPDRPVGRSRLPRAPVVVSLARELGLPFVQPVDPNAAECLERIRASRPDVLAVVAYGRLMGTKLLTLAPGGIINIHPSLLPKYRGASPIQAAIYDGCGQTGVTLMQMDEGLDTGPPIAARLLDIAPTDSALLVHNRLAAMGAQLLANTLADWEASRGDMQPQNISLATVTRRLERGDGELDLRRPARALYNQWRAFQPWPGVYVCVGRRRVIVRHMDQPSPDPSAMGRAELFGDVLAVGCGNGSLRIHTIQLEGRQSMSARSFVNGNSLLLSQTWGDPPPQLSSPLTCPVLRDWQPPVPTGADGE